MRRDKDDRPRSRTLQSVESMARKLGGASLAVLVQRGDEVERLTLSGAPAPLTPFCCIMRAGPSEGRHCITCRRLILLSAQFRGVTEFTCHGGIQMVVAPAANARRQNSAPRAVVSSAFAEGNRAKGWKAVQAHACDLRVDRKALHNAYLALPTLTEARRDLMRSIVEVAAAAIEELPCGLECRNCADAPKHGHSGSCHNAASSPDLDSLLVTLKDGSVEDPAQRSGSAITDMVAAMVAHDPSLPFTVAAIARAARMTPNHFSAVFHKHAGKTFGAFLADERIRFAKSLLLDPTLKVHEVAERAGFQDSAYFCRRFKQVTGSSASEWRQRDGATT